MRLLSFVAAVPFSLYLACNVPATGAGFAVSPAGAGRGNEPSETTVSAGPTPQQRAAAAVGHSAGNVAGSEIPNLTGYDVAALRAEGPPALQRLLAEYDRTGSDAARRTLGAMIDKVAGQRYATISRLYWYEDLAKAQAVARATGKPILSLRMLGRLDEDLSCANSRFFRTTLYPDAAVSALLRDKFVLHWSSERNAPRVTVDFGDGRKLESTITGNSAHYILDAEGRPIDVLPGLYAPAVFVRELKGAVALHTALHDRHGFERTDYLIKHHREAMEATGQRFANLPDIQYIVGARRLMTAGAAAGAAASAQRATVSKAYVEVPMLRTVSVGVDPGKVPEDSIELWAEIGQQLLRVDAKAGPILDPSARALVDALLAEPTDGQVLDADTRRQVIERLEQTIVADTAINETRLRQQIRAHLIDALDRDDADFAAVNAFIYENVFHTPAADAWMGLLPRDTFTGLPSGAVISRIES